MGAVARGAGGGDEVGPLAAALVRAQEFGNAVQRDLGGEGAGRAL